MCGIVAYFGKQNALPLLVSGLRRVEYRGYDSSGIAVVTADGIQITKKQGKIAELEKALASQAQPPSNVGIAHTRWATHGNPSDRNAHPHASCSGAVALVHNGTIENYQELRTLLKDEGHVFVSDTDTEVLPHLIEKLLSKGDDLVTAVQHMHALVKGAYGIAVIAASEPEKLVVARHGSPLVVGESEHGYFAASDATAFREHTDQVLYLEDGEMAVVDEKGIRVMTLQNKAVDKCFEQLEWDLSQIAKGGHEHFMIKEIMEQPVVLRHTLAGRLTQEKGFDVHLGGIEKIEPFLRSGMERVLITACGTSWHAGLIGKRIIEKLLRIPVMVEYASEFATSYTPVDAHTLCIAVTQSGETKDTIEAVRRAKNNGATIWAICNVVGSSMTRFADSGMYLHVGPEIGVASTKAFSAQVLAFSLFALKLVELRKPEWVSDDDRRSLVDSLRRIPEQVTKVLSKAEAVKKIAATFAQNNNALYLGRGYNFPTALEGALKLKEISYIHAEGYPAGEMKHGPIALIDANMPVLVIAPREAEDEKTSQKILANVEEVAARGGRVLLIASEGDEQAMQLQQSGRVETILWIPHTKAMFTPVLAGVYCQLFAYHVAVFRGCEIDQPRNLAKSVTVE